MFNIGALGDAISKAKDTVKEKAGSEMKKKTGKGKDKFKGFLADLAGGPGLLNDGGSKYNKDQKPFTTKEEAQEDAVDASAKAIESTAEPKSGGGFETTTPSKDRTDMGSNATVAFMRKKGYSW